MKRHKWHNRFLISNNTNRYSFIIYIETWNLRYQQKVIYILLWNLKSGKQLLIVSYLRGIISNYGFIFFSVIYISPLSIDCINVFNCSKRYCSLMFLSLFNTSTLFNILKMYSLQCTFHFWEHGTQDLENKKHSWKAFWVHRIILMQNSSIDPINKKNFFSTFLTHFFTYCRKEHENGWSWIWC